MIGYLLFTKIQEAKEAIFEFMQILFSVTIVLLKFCVCFHEICS